MNNNTKTKNIKINQDWFSKIDTTDLTTNDILNYCHLSEKEIVEGYGGIYEEYNEGGLN